jgi:hypothetical protein
MSVICIVTGAVLIYASYRLVLSVSEEKTQKYFKARGADRMPKEDAAAFNILNGAAVALALFFLGFFLVAGGSATLVGWDMFK